MAFSALCTFIERCLGDLFASLEEKRQPNQKLRRKPPPLIRDLLQTAEMEELLGGSLFLLQVIIGSPRALNLRNIVWHGFVASHELHPGFYWFLLWVGLEIFEREFPGLDVISAREMKDLGRIEDETYDFGIGALSALVDVGRDEITTNDLRTQISLLLHRSTFILPYRADTLMLAYDYFAKGEHDSYAYYFCLVLALPVLEHCLRSCWIHANDLPPPLLCADSFRYYTVLDMFLEPQLHPLMSVETLTTGSLEGTEASSSASLSTTAGTSRPNLLTERIGNRIMIALNDTFLYPLGPRPRDRISHGDINPKSVTRFAAARCFEMILYLALHHYGSSAQSGEGRHSSLCLPLHNCMHFFDNYVSCWHPHSLLERQFSRTVRSSWLQWLQAVLSIPRPETIENMSEDVITRRFGYRDETEAGFSVIKEITSKRNLTSLSSSVTPLLDFFTIDALSSEPKALQTSMEPLKLTFFNCLDSPAFVNSSCESARKICLEVDKIILMWLTRLLAQKEQIQAGTASKRLESSFHKQLLVLDLATTFFASMLHFCESQLHFSILDVKNTRKVLNPIVQMRQKIENNSWDEIAGILVSTMNILSNLVS